MLRHHTDCYIDGRGVVKIDFVRYPEQLWRRAKRGHEVTLPAESRPNVIVM